MVKRRVIFISVPRVVELVIAGANSIQTGAMLVLRNARLRRQRAQFRRRRKRYAPSPATYAMSGLGRRTRYLCAGPGATANVPHRTLSATSAALTQTVRFDGRRQRVCVLRVAPILDVDEWLITAGKAVDFLWGVRPAAERSHLQTRCSLRMCKSAASERPVSTAYGDSVASDCGASAALWVPVARIAVLLEMSDGAAAK